MRISLKRNLLLASLALIVSAILIPTTALAQEADCGEILTIDLTENESVVETITVNLPAAPATEVDVFFIVDLSNSFQEELDAFRTQAAGIITGLQAQGYNLRFGVARFEDYPILPFGDDFFEDQAYGRVIDLTDPNLDTDGNGTPDVIQVLDGLELRAGFDLPESQLAAVYQAATGAGQSVEGFPNADIPAGQGATFRPNAKRIIILWTDASFHRQGDAPVLAGFDYQTREYPGPTFNETITALNDNNIEMIGVISAVNFDFSGMDDMRTVVAGAGTVAGPGGIDYDGDGIIDIAEGDPVVAQLGGEENEYDGLTNAIVTLVGAVANRGNLNLVAIDDPLTPFDESQAIASINPATYDDIDLNAGGSFTFDVTFTRLDSTTSSTITEFTVPLEAQVNGGTVCVTFAEVSTPEPVVDPDPDPEVCLVDNAPPELVKMYGSRKKHGFDRRQKHIYVRVTDDTGIASYEFYNMNNSVGSIISPTPVRSEPTDRGGTIFYFDTAPTTVQIRIDWIRKRGGISYFNEVIDICGKMTEFDPVYTTVDPETPEEFDLSQNYPNPFNPTTNIQFNIAEPGQVSLKVYDVTGRVVRTLVSEDMQAGVFNIEWDGKNDAGISLASGLYLYRLEAANFSQTLRMTLLK